MEKENYLNEAFTALNCLDEDVFDIDTDGLVQAQDFVNNAEEIEDVETVIDPLAETEEDLQDSYIGNVILDCIICQSKIYKKPEEVIVDEEVALANVGEICPYCQSSDGFKVIGQVAEYCPDCEDEEKEESDIESEEEKDDVDESIKTKKGVKKQTSMKEGLNKVEIETEDQKIEIEAEPKENNAIESSDEMIAPIEPETEEKFKDIDVNEFDENEFDELGERYLRKTYENVRSYKTTNGSTNGNKLKLEGIITFKSGKQAKTNFMFEAATITSKGKVKFLGENQQFAKGKKAFTLTGRVENGKLLSESLMYNYRSKNASGKSQRVYGRVVK